MQIQKIADEFEALSDTGFHNVEILETWLSKYDAEYRHQKAIYNSLKENGSIPLLSESFKDESIFVLGYEIVQEVVECSKDEPFFKEQIEIYEAIKNDVTKLSLWLQEHYLETDGKQSRLRKSFQDTRRISGYDFTVTFIFGPLKNVPLEISEWEYTAKFLDVIERSKKIQLTGIVQHINDVEVIQQNSTNRRTQSIVIDPQDCNLSTFQISFYEDKVQLLDKIEVGQKVKVLVQLYGRKDKKNKSKHYHGLLGWDIENLN
ncbi:DUF3127 domain-containing protein [Flavobacterium antarcticum]|uniref:DUF3127 domain-containing protein n=1 Tax=Flavobacterium antarcticum TaxID=271155 RepID=UPI0003B38754|nr:DUF3127 domain-containing protein [Flavobacterium antarcticum]